MRRVYFLLKKNKDDNQNICNVCYRLHFRREGFIAVVFAAQTMQLHLKIKSNLDDAS